MATDWITKQPHKHHSYAIHVDSQAALLAIANKKTTQPIAANIRTKTIQLKKTTRITFHWVKGHVGLRGNERADYLAKTVASHQSTIAYSAIPIASGKKMLEQYYINIWNSTYSNSESARHTKLFIPNIPHRLSLSLWPNYILTQFLTNHGCFRSYLHRMNKIPSPICNCPEKAIQTAHHLLTECSSFSKERPRVLQVTPLPEVLKHHIHTVNVSNFITAIFRKLQE